MGVTRAKAHSRVLDMSWLLESLFLVEKELRAIVFSTNRSGCHLFSSSATSKLQRLLAERYAYVMPPYLSTYSRANLADEVDIGNSK